MAAALGAPTALPDRAPSRAPDRASSSAPWTRASESARRSPAARRDGFGRARARSEERGRGRGARARVNGRYATHAIVRRRLRRQRGLPRQFCARLCVRLRFRQVLVAATASRPLRVGRIASRAILSRRRRVALMGAAYMRSQSVLELDTSWHKTRTLFSGSIVNDRALGRWSTWSARMWVFYPTRRP